MLAFVGAGCFIPHHFSTVTGSFAAAYLVRRLHVSRRLSEPNEGDEAGQLSARSERIPFTDPDLVAK